MGVVAAFFGIVYGHSRERRLGNVDMMDRSSIVSRRSAASLRPDWTAPNRCTVRCGRPLAAWSASAGLWNDDDHREPIWRLIQRLTARRRSVLSPRAQACRSHWCRWFCRTRPGSVRRSGRPCSRPSPNSATAPTRWRAAWPSGAPGPLALSWTPPAPGRRADRTRRRPGPFRPARRRSRVGGNPIVVRGRPGERSEQPDPDRRRGHP